MKKLLLTAVILLPFFATSQALRGPKHRDQLFQMLRRVEEINGMFGANNSNIDRSTFKVFDSLLYRSPKLSEDEVQLFEEFRTASAQLVILGEPLALRVPTPVPRIELQSIGEIRLETLPHTLHLDTTINNPAPKKNIARLDRLGLILTEIFVDTYPEIIRSRDSFWGEYQRQLHDQVLSQLIAIRKTHRNQSQHQQQLVRVQAQDHYCQVYRKIMWTNYDLLERKAMNKAQENTSFEMIETGPKISCAVGGERVRGEPIAAYKDNPMTTGDQ